MNLIMLLVRFAAAACLAPLGAFLAGLAFFPDLGFGDATFERRALTRAFLASLAAALATGCSVSVCSVIDVMLFSPFWAVITASMTSIALWRSKRKANL